MTALLFTAVVTPVEVAFLDEGRHITTLWWVNRVVDLCFLIDMLLCFNMAYQVSPSRGGHWVHNRRLIVQNYLRTWFLPDLVTVLPFFLIVLDWQDPFGNGASDPTSDRSSAVRSMSLIRVVKLLRMIKLARVFKASRMIERNLLDIALHRWEWTFSLLKMLKLCLLLLVYAHFQACVWGLFSAWTPEPNWLSEYARHFAETEVLGAEPSPLDKYAAALYWSVMTLTSIGYGDFVPQNTAERALCCFWMVASAGGWAYVIGTAAGIAATLDPNSVLYQTTMDQLNYFMRERGLPKAMRMTLREYFSNARRVHQLNDDGDLLEKMSPLLQGTVALTAYKQWIDHIW
mgnify:CR=1 FL=1